MSELFKNIVKLPPPHTARSYSELTPVYTADEVAKTVSSFEVELAKANERVKELELALEKETVRKQCAFRHEERLEEENRELRRQRFRTYNDEEYIIFFDDGEDYPESMVAPVVMSADKFRELLYAREQLRKGGES
jgi:predicted phosphoribosyltransferase